MHGFDVLVAGGGSAGLAAAVAAARIGARTLLVERSGVLGGMAPAALVHSICGLYESGDCAAAKTGGGTNGASLSHFPAEFAARLRRAGGAHGPVKMGKVRVLLQQPIAFAQTADAFARETPNLEVRLHSELISVGGDFCEAVLCCRGARETIGVKVVVDASGDAVAAAIGGAACEQEPGERLQRPAFIFAMQGVAEGVLDDDGRLRLAGRIASGVQSGALHAGALGAALRASARPGEAFVTIDLDMPGYDPLDVRCLTQLEMHGRALATQLAEFLRREAPGFEESCISAFPARVGVRESRRIIGRYRLEAADIEKSAHFDDAVALAMWPMEMRETNRGARLRFSESGRPCDIPLRSLRARDHDNLFAAGRCIACSHEAQASIRVIGTCLATGEAAGIAAGLLATRGECDAETVRTTREEIERCA